MKIRVAGVDVEMGEVGGGSVYKPNKSSKGKGGKDVGNTKGKK